MDVLQTSTSAHTCEAIAAHENESVCHRSNIKLNEESCKGWHLFIAANKAFALQLGLLPTYAVMPLPNAASISVRLIILLNSIQQLLLCDYVVWLEGKRATSLPSHKALALVMWLLGGSFYLNTTKYGYYCNCPEMFSEASIWGAERLIAKRHYRSKHIFQWVRSRPLFCIKHLAEVVEHSHSKTMVE